MTELTRTFTTRTCTVYTHYERDVKKQIQCGRPAAYRMQVQNPQTDELEMCWVCEGCAPATQNLVLVR